MLTVVGCVAHKSCSRVLVAWSRIEATVKILEFLSFGVKKALLLSLYGLTEYGMSLKLGLQQ